MSRMYDIKKYIDLSFRYGMLYLPFPPTEKQIKQELMQILKE